MIHTLIYEIFYAKVYVVQNYFLVGDNHKLLPSFYEKLANEECMRYSLIVFLY